MISRRNVLISICAVAVSMVPLPSSAKGGNWRIRAGDLASLGQFPSVLNHEEDMEGGYIWFCCATIIDTNLYLTAAHCVCRSQMKHRVNTNLLNRYEKSGPDNEYEAEEIIIHPQYSCNQDENTAGNDMAIGRVNKPFKMSKTVKIAPLATRFVDVESATIAGFGGDDRSKVGKEHDLKWGRVKTMKCPPSIGDGVCLDYATNAQLCGSGDSGGPMYNQANELMGACSRTVSTGGKEYDVYSSVVKRIDWIKQTMTKLGGKFGGKSTHDGMGESPSGTANNLAFYSFLSLVPWWIFWLVFINNFTALV